MESNNKVLEALRMQPLSEEEKASRHILARLYGPIATTKGKTRNGRGYNAELWHKALTDEVFREKVANKSLFLELGHPVDREETDMEKVCACIPELPKIVDGDLYAYVDILDTKNGRLLKTLCDYGFIPGISSRGSGDIMANNEVDPETFFLETWDIVQLPAVKKARLTMCESLNNKTLQRALKESFEKMNEEEVSEAIATLERFDIDANFASTDDDLEWLPGEGPEHNLVEDAEESDDAEEQDTLEDEEAIVDDATEADDPELPEEEEEEPEEETPAENMTIKTFIACLDEYDENLPLEFLPIEVDGQTLNITELILDDDAEDKVTVSFNYNLETSDNIEDTEEEPEADEVSSPEEVEEPEAEETDEEATDSGDEEVIESLMAAVRQKDALSEEVADLKNQKAVSDAEAKRLKEELAQYKTGFMRVSELASKASKLQKANKSLQEQLSAQDSTIRTLKENANKRTQLTESIERNKAEVKALQERLQIVLKDAETTEQTLKEQVETSRAAAQKNAKAANAYKQKYLSVVEHYIASKAKMLGVTARDVKSRLNEGYTLDDVDHVCDILLTEGKPTFGFTRGSTSAANMKVHESFGKGSDNLDDFADLLELAGLK